MKTCSISLLAVLALAGCVQQAPKKPDMPLSDVAPTPVCSGEEQCGRMWKRAIEGAQMVTRMKVMSVNDSFIQTYPTNRIGYLNGQVFKQALGDGKYAINGSFNCSPSSWCSNLLNQSQNLFNLQVQGFEKR